MEEDWDKGQGRTPGDGVPENEAEILPAGPPAPEKIGLEGHGRERTTGQGSGWRALHSVALSKDAHDWLSIFVVRAVFFFAAAGLGVAGVRVLNEVTGRSGHAPIDPFIGILVACGTALLLITCEMLFSKSPIRTLSAITFGLLIGLALSLVFQFVVEFIVTAVSSPDFLGSQGPTLLSFLQVVTTTIFCYFGITTLLRTKDDFKFIIPYVEFRKELRGNAPLILDTSCFVDGRIQALMKTGLFDQRLLVPKFVLAELQTIADSADKSLRERGRRGMDILHEIEKEHHVEVIDPPTSSGQKVDGALLEAARTLGGKIVTTDYNLQKNARLQGISLLNINDLATAMKPVFVPGESLNVRLLREGDDRGQAVGFLKDGTMVVVENARQRIGQEVAVEVTSALQTNAGKMVFGKLRRPTKLASET